ncbi:MAG TPA: GEVED domain-containing protein [Draconibacterium sp.]|nr:GEVED domain-containing protein [Draconibacterium sp.]
MLWINSVNGLHPQLKLRFLKIEKPQFFIFIVCLFLLGYKNTNAQINTLSNWTNEYHGTSTSAQTIGYTVPAGSNSNRILIVAVASSTTSANTRTVTLTYGGQSPTGSVGDISGNNIQHTQIYYFNEAKLDAASNTTLSVAVSGGTTSMTDVFVAVFDGVDQTTPITNSQNYNSGTTSVDPFQFATGLSVNANDQAIEIISTVRIGSTTARTISSYATNWSSGATEQTGSYNTSGTANDQGIRNSVANRSIPTSTITDVSSVNLSGTARASMTAISFKEYIPTTPPLCTTSITPANSATAVSVNSSLTWNSSFGATGYRIYLGTDASATNILNGVDLGNVTTYTPASSLGFLTDYYWKIVPYNSYGAASGCSIWSFTTEDISYCIPTYSTGTGEGDFISRVQLDAINNITTGSSSPYYNYYSTLSTDLTLGNTYTITVGSGTYSTGNNISVWIDFDQSGSFTVSEKLGNVTLAGNSTGTINFTVPTNAVLGTTRLRVRESYNTSSMDPCLGYVYGETEDYNVKMIPSCANATLTLNTANSAQIICENESITNIGYTIGGDATGASVTGLPAGVSGSYNSTSHTFTISGTPAVSGTFNFSVTTTGTPTNCSEATANGTLAVNPIPSAPTVTGSSVCIGSIATLSASGATGVENYVWYDVASGGTPLKTSSGSTDNTFDTPTLNATTNYWVAIVNAQNCESLRTQVTATFPAVSPYDQTISGNDTWVGHVYDGTDFDTYYGTYNETQTFLQVFGSNTFCFGINSNLDNRSVYTETFSVRYRMTTSLSGCYLVNLRADDGIRLFVDGIKVFDRWVNQAPTNYNNVLLPLTTNNAQVVYEYYENGGQNEVAFQNLYKIENNVLTSGTNQTFCEGSPAVQISAENLKANNLDLPSGITTTWQWYYSNSPTNTGLLISGATGQNYTPSGSPFNTPGTYYVYRVATVSSSNAANENNWGATNPVSCSFESDRATIEVNPLPVVSVSTPNSSICAEEDVVFNLTGTSNALVTYKINGGADLSITLSGAGLAIVTISNATSNQTLTLVSVNDGTCSDSITETETVTVHPLPTIGSFN